MNILETIGTILTALSALAAVTVWVFLKIKAAKTPNALTQAELDEMITVERQVQASLFAVVTSIERQYGSGTGELKLAAAIEKTIALLPAALRPLVPAETIANWLENALADAKIKWEKNAKLLGERDSNKADTKCV
jgi:hypothetical protein